ncbi:hypothetical protein L2649_10175 [Thermoactinomyces vulgaris]|jgi:hypothetical protein|uniref:hypothetical protein n=1 Tax=Thermoactinomyces TaxID=2023 RepID=UPI00067392B7|nr:MULTISPECIES: hypothetical protein [Thermoactinomyces]MBH8583530.1 hypothetical protein [Thermoactinomyces sp. CICC 10735]MCF6135536.1 hypothetical protein [Thermoactinomyces vulgaris]QBK13144.1 hypothetical protein AB849_005735 [Thermoactinomyces vulgaris]QCV54514.1 hypothetical protein FA954_02165 [Thermoactinomyces vulgaris]
MEKLEYHLMEDGEEISVLYEYPSVSKEEVMMRFACDYFVRGKDVFECVHIQADPPVHKIYVKRSEEEKVLDDRLRFSPTWQGIRMEVRHFDARWSGYPVVHCYQFHHAQDALLRLLGSLHYIDGQWWKTTSTEVDENRYVYVIYAVPVLKEGGGNG